MHTGASLPFRAGAADSAHVTGVRTSACGCYALVVFKGLPGEVWAVPEGMAPVRLRQIELPFTAAEWQAVPSENDAGATAQGDPFYTVRWGGENHSTSSAFASDGSTDGGSLEHLPEALLAFALAGETLTRWQHLQRWAHTE